MFQTIDIKAYRGLKNITLQNLSRVNILVGENNTGKTSTKEYNGAKCKKDIKIES